MAVVYFRNDDIMKLSSKFRRFHELMVSNNIPINYAVIPYHITQRAIDFLNKEMKKHPITLSQHGYKHENYGSTKKYEFGKSRSLQQQYKDIKKGKEIMDENFDHPNIFTTPYNEFDNNTIACLKKLKFKALSAGNLCPKNFPSLPTQIFFENYPENKLPYCRSLKETTKQFLLQKTNKIGILSHHEVFTNKDFITWEKFIKVVKHKYNPIKWTSSI